MTPPSSSPIASRYTKIRVAQFAVAVVVLVVGLALTFHQVPGHLLWPLALSLVIPSLFSEPYFTGPRLALATASAQVGAYFSSDRTHQAGLWNFLLILSIIVIVSSLLAMVRGQRPGEIFHWISTRVGRAIVLGSIVALILVVQVATATPDDVVGMSLVVILLYAVLFLDWARLTLQPTILARESAVVTAVCGPNQVLVRSFGRLSVGTRVSVDGEAGSSLGYVAEDLASDTGSQYRVVLDDHWRTVANRSDAPCVVTASDDQASQPRGFAIEGSTENTLRINPTSRLRLGETLELEDLDGRLFYQVAGLRLEQEVWAGGAAVVPRARLIQVGTVDDDGMIVGRPSLPEPYAAVHSASAGTSDLSNDYLQIGVLKGTAIPVGIKKDWASNHGHLAILGMSGMGKTTVAAKLPALASAADKFVIFDETSEYRTRLNFQVTALNALDWTASGVEVCEPGGDLPVVCEGAIRSAMTAAQAEYASGHMPQRRFLLLEEAHGWLPEWNFTSRANADATNRSCRYILQARKFNLTFILVSQRTAVISKSAISQCENYIILRTLDQTSLEYVEGVVGSELKGLVPELARYEAICVGPIFNSDGPIIVTLNPAGSQG